MNAFPGEDERVRLMLAKDDADFCAEGTHAEGAIICTRCGVPLTKAQPAAEWEADLWDGWTA